MDEADENLLPGPSLNCTVLWPAWFRDGPGTGPVLLADTTDIGEADRADMAAALRLTRLIRQAAITAVLNGTERITRTRLDGIRLDHLAEQHHRPTPTPTRPLARVRTRQP
ncbi:hypothetical protein [Streptomyces sp. NBC_01363]|uniref:hypothetical protein n=1 Tax=Streptomyces sp. NBC_01363 TaxID=2903840 RepID=UPI0022548552|nr:hypothetical protein [Streptomyces sp. NBC_01363]MCX4735799.1 hypothetical protein [Streptomyces sp. NBC_01363]